MSTYITHQENNNKFIYRSRRVEMNADAHWSNIDNNYMIQVYSVISTDNSISNLNSMYILPIIASVWTFSTFLWLTNSPINVFGLLFGSRTDVFRLSLIYMGALFLVPFFTVFLTIFCLKLRLWSSVPTNN